MLSPKRVAALSAGLLALNVWIAWRLFNSQYLDEMSSIAGIYIAIGRYAAAHWPHIAWWPLWFGGMPIGNVYEPALHLVSATLIGAGGLGPARAYHVAVGLAYCLGPVTLFWLALRLSRNLWASLATGLLYSLASPSAWLVGAIRDDIGGPGHASRLHAAVHYADSPHMAGLTLVPLAILAFDFALERRTMWPYALAACAMAAVPLTNIPAAIVLAFAVIAYVVACGAREQRRRSDYGGGLGGGRILSDWSGHAAIHCFHAARQYPEDAAGERVRPAPPGRACDCRRPDSRALQAVRAMRDSPRGPVLLSAFLFHGLYCARQFLVPSYAARAADPFSGRHGDGDGGNHGSGVQWLLTRWRRAQILAFAAFAAFCVFQVPIYRAYAHDLIQRIESPRGASTKSPAGSTPAAPADGRSCWDPPPGG